MSKTIKEIAEELGYSKTYISQTLKKEGLQSSLRKIGNKFVIDEDIEVVLKKVLDGETKTKNENSEVFIFLKEQLKEKDNQIAKKDDQIEKLNERLKETNIMLNESRKELVDTKKLLIETENETKK